MKPVDYRNATWEGVRGQVDGLRMRVWQGMLDNGWAYTTREWAAMLDMDLLTVRPRITELLQLGFVELVEGECGMRSGECGVRNSHEGRYRAVSEFTAWRAFEARCAAERNPQLELGL